jgi:hypothetical protein
MRIAAGFFCCCQKTSAIRIRVPEKLDMERAKERANAVPLATDAPQGFVAQALPRAEARALVPRPRSGRLGILMKEKSRERRSSKPIEIPQEGRVPPRGVGAVGK